MQNFMKLVITVFNILAPTISCTGYLKEEILEKLLENYDSFILPYQNGPVDVEVALLVVDMNPINNEKLYDHYYADIIIHQSWYDYRLQYQELSNETITVGGELDNEIWQPDTRVMTEKHSYPVELIKKSFQLTLHPDGTVFTSRRTRSMNFCKMDFSTFPFDSQICDFRLELFSYSSEYVKLKWKQTETKKGLVFTRKLNLEQLEVLHYKISSESFTYPGNGSGTHNQLSVKFHFKRPMIFYLVRLYLPNFIIVVLSWAGFWVDYRSLSARVTIGITTVLTINELRLSIYKENGSAGRDLNLFDIYSFVCFFFVLAGLIEYSIAQSIDIKYRLRDFYKAQQNLSMEDDGLDYEDTVEQNITDTSSKGQDRVARRKFRGWQKFTFEFIDYQHSIVRDKYHALDKISQYVFPSTFILINIIYVGVVAYYRNSDEKRVVGFEEVTW